MKLKKMVEGKLDFLFHEILIQTEKLINETQ